MINQFKDEYNWLSNLWNINITYEGEIYKSVEYAYVAAKFEDYNFRLKVQQCKTSTKARRFGKKYSNKIRKDWNEIKLNIMRELLKNKFSNFELKEKLLATENKKLVNENDYKDTYWGEYNGMGENNLGKLLMEIREDLKD